MVLEKLGSSLRSVLEKVTKAIFVDETLVNEIVKDIQRALLQADVNVKLVFEISNRLKKRVKEKVSGSVTKKEQLIKIVYDELVAFVGTGSKIEVTKKPFKIMLVGLFGSGKTTTSGKIAKYFSTRGNKVCVLGLDVYRPAAAEQLKQNAERAGVKAFTSTEKDPLKIYEKFENELKNYDIVIIDTAGRDSLSNELINELNKLNKRIVPDETLLVISADIGQAAEAQAKSFKETCDISGVVITKLEGSAKGGGALTACAVTNSPVKFIGVGEKINDLEEFHANRFVSKLLGMGDLETLLEKAREVISEEKAEDLGKRFLRGEYNLIDLYEQMQAMRKMGPLNKLIDMVPGFSQLKLPKEALKVQEDKLDKWRHSMDSLTQLELENPDVINSSRIERISKGSGVPVHDIREMIKQYKQSKKIVKMLKGSSPEKLMKKFGKAKFKF